MNYYTDEHFDWNSSVIDTLYYDRDTNTLYVDFASGSVRGYEGVSLETYQDFVDAYSLGSFWNREIKGNYKSFEVSELAERETTAVPAEQVAYSSQIAYDADVALSVNRIEEKPVHGYTVTFVTNGIEGQFNTDATSEEQAANEWRTLMDRLGLVATSAKVERDLV